MKFALVGVGAAGGRIVDRLGREESDSDRSFSYGNYLVFDTDKSAFEEYDQVPLDRHVLIADTHPDIRGEGVDGDVDLGAHAANDDIDEIHREFDKLAIHEVDVIVVVAGLGGGTGGGAGAVLIENLQAISDNPIYAIGVLPHAEEDDQLAINAARSLQSFVRLADNVFLFDNDAWVEDVESIDEQYDSLNDVLATRFVSLLAAGELDSTDIAENRIDSSDLVRTLEPGGISTIGHASTTVGNGDGFLHWLRSLLGNGESESPPTDAVKIKQLIRDAATSRLTLPCELTSAERALVVLSGPSEICSRKGFESGRYWLEQETDTVEVLAGDEPRPSASKISATVLLTNVTDVPRIDALQRQALEARSQSAQR
jgi:cell division GTPase FtsZ